MKLGRRRGATALVVTLQLIATSAHAEAPPLLLVRDPAVDPNLSARVREVAESRRSLRAQRPLPQELGRSPEVVANEQRVAAIAGALARARQHEAEAQWDGCAREAGDALGDATELLASSGDLAMLRDLHLQIGACMSLGPQPGNARPHFRQATLLDEAPPPKGVHREEAELAHEQARAEVLALLHGPVTIETEPPGAEVWIDGRKLDGATPLVANVRLGSHFVTLRRFRFEPQTQQVLLQPDSTARFALQSARADTLREQLAEVSAGKRVAPKELRLARALWSGAEQLLLLSQAPGPVALVRLELSDATSGATLRTAQVPIDADDDALRDGVCAALGETCLPPEQGVPWYVWPIGGLALVGGAVAIGFAVDGARDTRFCPPAGCD